MTGGRETIIGGAVFGVLILLLMVNGLDRDAPNEGSDGYGLEAVFQRSEGLAIGAEVRMAGILVGRVTGQTLTDNFRAKVTLQIDNGIQVPDDSAAIIETDGLLGAKYIELQPGGAEETLPPGGQIEYTQGSVIIEELLAKIVNSAKARRQAASQPTASSSDQPDDATPPSAPAPENRAPQPEAPVDDGTIKL